MLLPLVSARRLAVLAALVLGPGVASCQDPYLTRRDTLTAGSGDAVQANIAKHVIDPWPAHALQIERDSSGERAQHAIERYRNPSSGTSGSALPAVPVGPASVAPVSSSGFR
jgi:hypothetical protein